MGGGDTAGSIFDALGVGDGRATVLLNDYGHGRSLYSALKTCAP